MASPKAKAGKKKLSQKARREAVETAIREHGWDHGLALDLAKKTGWALRTIYRDRDSVITLLTQEEQADLPRRRAAFLADLRALKSAAKKGGAYAPAAKLMAMESVLLGLDRVPLPTVEEPDGPVDTSLEGILAETRRLRKRAMAGDSYVAADRLLEREHEIVKSIDQRDEAARKAQGAGLTEAEIVAMIEDAAASLPDQIKRRLVAALGGT